MSKDLSRKCVILVRLNTTTFMMEFSELWFDSVHFNQAVIGKYGELYYRIGLEYILNN